MCAGDNYTCIQFATLDVTTIHSSSCVSQASPFEGPNSSSLWKKPKYKLFWGVPGFGG